LHDGARIWFIGCRVILWDGEESVTKNNTTTVGLVVAVVVVRVVVVVEKEEEGISTDRVHDEAHK